MRIMRWLTGVAARALGGRGRAADDDGCPCFDCRQAAGDEARGPWRRSLSESALAAFYRVSAERDAMRAERDRWRGEAERAAAPAAWIDALLTEAPNGPSHAAAPRASRLCQDRGYAQAEADIAARLRQRAEELVAGAVVPRLGVLANVKELRAVTLADIATCVERGDHRPRDRSERCAGCGAETADERGRYVLRTANGYCDSCMSYARWASEGARTYRDAIARAAAFWKSDRPRTDTTRTPGTIDLEAERLGTWNSSMML